MLGGLDWSNRLVDHLAEQFTRKHGTDPRQSAESIRSFFQECEDAKRALSKKPQVPITVYHEGKTLTVALTRQDFERMTSDLMQRTEDTTSLVLQQAGVDPAKLDEVVLIGGSTYMPIVERMVTEVCGREPSRSLMPEEAVAQGAAIHAAILEAKHSGTAGRMAAGLLARLRSINTSDVNSHSLGIKVSPPREPNRKINHIMIPRNTAIPFAKRQKFVTNVDNQKEIHVYILEGEAEDPDACTEIGDFRVVDLPPGLPKGSPVEINYRYDKNGRIHAEAKELTSNRMATTEIVRAGVDEAALAAFESLATQYQVD
jgi:molecular chaperone DnaK